jgi:hypothetical protein
MSDIWIPNIDLMVSQEVKNNNTDQKNLNIQSTNPLNVFFIHYPPFKNNASFT